MNFKINTPILLLVIVSVFAGCGPSGEEAIFVVPEDYTGYILVIYDQENGAEKEYKDKARIYRIPSDGILLSKFSSNPGWTDFPKFYRGSITPENEVPFVVDIKNVPIDKVSAFGGSAGGVNRDLGGKEVLRFIEYYIGNQLEIEKSAKERDTLDIIKLVDTSQTREGL